MSNYKFAQVLSNNINKFRGESVEDDAAEKYILEQAKIEVEHTRSWPPKVMAFYIAINFGLVASLITLRKGDPVFALPCWAKVPLSLLIFFLSCWVVFILRRNHLSYLTYRNLQIIFQKRHLESFKGKQREYEHPYKIPDDWFEVNDVRLSKRFHGWGFYFYIVLVVTVLTLAALCQF